MRTTAKVAVILSRRVRWCRPKKRKEELLLFSRLASPRRWKTGLLALTPSSRGWSKLFRVSPKKKRSLASFRPLYDGWCPALALHVHHHTAEGGLAGVRTYHYYFSWFTKSCTASSSSSPREMKRKKSKIMEGPERVVCCTLCLCMAVAVFSSVALVYLTGKDRLQK